MKKLVTLIACVYTVLVFVMIIFIKRLNEYSQEYNISNIERNDAVNNDAINIAIINNYADYSNVTQTSNIKPIKVETTTKIDDGNNITVTKTKTKKYPKIEWFEFLSNKYNVNYEDIFDISSITIKYCKQFGISSNHIMAMIGVESNFRPKARSHLGAQYGRGLCQISELALKEYNWHNSYNEQYEPMDLYDPNVNIKIACWYYARLRDHYKKGPDFKNIMSAYNRGPYDKGFATSYVNKIIDNLVELR